MKKLLAFETCSRHYDTLAKTRSRMTTQLSRFPAKMTLPHEEALPSIEKISYSQSFSFQNLKVSSHNCNLFQSPSSLSILVSLMFPVLFIPSF